MSKNVNLDDDAVAALEAHKRQGESYSKVIKRLIAPPIRTFGDLEEALNEIEGPILDINLIEKLHSESKRSKRPAHAD